MLRINVRKRTEIYTSVNKTNGIGIRDVRVHKHTPITQVKKPIYTSLVYLPES